MERKYLENELIKEYKNIDAPNHPKTPLMPKNLLPTRILIIIPGKKK